MSHEGLADDFTHPWALGERAVDAGGRCMHTSCVLLGLLFLAHGMRGCHSSHIACGAVEQDLFGHQCLTGARRAAIPHALVC